MTLPEFQMLNVQFHGLMSAYVGEVGKTANLLATTESSPSSFRRRFAILRQEIAENEAHQLYVAAKREMYATVVSGYEDRPFTPRA